MEYTRDCRRMKRWRPLRQPNQFDATVITTQIAGLPLVGPANPEASMNATSVWLQGLPAGPGFRLYRGGALRPEPRERFL